MNSFHPTTKPLFALLRFVLPLALLVEHPGMAASEEAEVPLEYAITFVQQGWGQLGIDKAASAPGKEGRDLRIQDTTYERGIGTHAPSTIAVDLFGEFERFEAEVGVEWQPTAQPGSVVFQVLVDGEKRFESGTMRQEDPARKVNVPLVGAMEMLLVVTDAGDGITCDSANWANAKLFRSTTASTEVREGRFDIAPFARIVTWDPAQTFSHPGRVAELQVDEIFPETEVPLNGDGTFTVPVFSDGQGCIGLQWLENRYIKELAIEFEQTAPDEARVEWWTGESAWQGDWKPLSGELLQEENRLSFRIGRQESWSANLGAQKIRWIFPTGESLAARKLEAYTFTRAQVVNLRLELEDPQPGKSGELEIYNGAMIEPSGDQDSQKRTWELENPLEMKVRYCRSKRGLSKADRTILRVHLPSGGFGVSVEDILDNECVYVPDFGFFVTHDRSGKDLEGYKKEILGRKTILQRVREMPDQSFPRAMAKVHRKVQNNGPTMLSLACDNNKFVVQKNGSVLYRKDPEIGLDEDRRVVTQEPALLVEMIPQYGSGKYENQTRHLEGEWLPVPVSTIESAGVVYRHRSFVAPFAGDGANNPPGWLDSKPLFVAEVSMENPSDLETDPQLELAFRIPSEPTACLELKESQGGYSVLEGQRLLAFVETGAAPSLRAEIQNRVLSLTGSLSAKSSVSVSIYIPGWETSLEQCGELVGRTNLLADVQEYWLRVLEPAMKIEIPDPLLSHFIRSSQVHCLIDARSEENGERVSAWCGADRYGPLESESQAIIHGMGLVGHEEFARRSLDYFIRRYNKDGLLTTGYTLMGLGWHLWTLGAHYDLYHNTEWMREVAPRLERACQWIVREREKTKRTNSRGEKVLEYGLTPPGVAADWPRFAHRSRPLGEYYAGLTAVARCYGDIGYPSADSLLDNAVDFRREILRAYHWTQERSPVVKLPNGTWIPYCPAIMGCFGRVMDIFPNEDGGRSWGKDMSMGAHNLIVLGVLDEADTRSIGWITDYLEDFWCLQQGMGEYSLEENRRDWFDLGGFSKVQPYYTRIVEIYALTDDVKPFIRAYFNAIPSLLNTENLNFWEHFHNQGAWNKAHETGWFLAQTRLMLVMERKNDELWLAPFVTNQWMQDGMTVKVANAPTRYGTIGYEITSHVDQGYIEATVHPPDRSLPKTLVLRLRHPEGKRIVSVSVNGEPHDDFDAEREFIRLKPSPKPIQVLATYE